MTATIFLASLNMAASMGLTMLIAYKLLRFGAEMIGIERLGLGIAGGSAFMTLAPIYGSVVQIETPFDQWSVLLLRVGFIMFLFGRVFRYIRHEVANRNAVDAARQYLHERGRL